MTAFVALSGPQNSDRSARIADNVQAYLNASNGRWRTLLADPGRLIAVAKDGRVKMGMTEGCSIFVIGDIFPRTGQNLERLISEATGFGMFCAKLAADFWGSYTAIQLAPDGISVFRDPIGMRDVISWAQTSVRVVASDPMPWLPLSAPNDLAIDWQRIGELLRSSSTVAEAPPLVGVETVAPGVMTEYRGAIRETHRLWLPRQFYLGSGAKTTSAELNRTVRECINAWNTAYPVSMLEISGGFDSAVVAAVIGNGGHRIEFGINFFADDIAGDERRYARDVAAHTGVTLREMLMPVGRLDDADLEDMPIGVRPGLGSTTLFHDRLSAELATSARVGALFTGNGGDAVFFQHPTAAIAADPSFPRTHFGAYVDLARWSKTSIWTVARHAFLQRAPACKSSDTAMSRLPINARFREPPSSWAGNVDGIPPAKKAQILAIAGDRGAFGPSWRRRSLTVIHPLLSQPLVELAIATDTFHLTQGRRDRALAREAFADDVPISTIQRRGKGSLSSFFGRSLAASVPFLRSYLLDGLLVRHGILDPVRLGAMLDRDFLMRFDCYAKILSALIMEYWVRAWTERLEAMA
ncbi:asparagine synthase-related protein [Sphingopyxis sp. MG]|uniref:asparagine synthase-related protein n=1 Tax=Sphingopyxis sp. MG TaxID=1866325 RepID=UPI000CDF315E|nr:asparagine synthase C-terminal domain-containing protein [Sphingopyxis sp. MG]AVA13608.1 hypothetical protein C3E99_06930 [Sphingopyxis sp. MG]